MVWEPKSVKTQLRSAIQRLGQLQAKKDAEASITRKDIATLIQQDNVALARSKVQKLIREDSLTDLLEVLEQHVGTVLDRFSELEQQLPPSPALLEATSSIIFAAPRIQLKELNVISHILAQRLGPEIARSAVSNRDKYVSPRVLQAILRPTPNAFELNAYLERIAQMYGMSWTAGPQRQDLVDALSEVLNPGAAVSIDIVRLRQLCVQGVPDEPGWLRPRIWRLLLGSLSDHIDNWKAEVARQRDSYYDLIRRLLKPVDELPPPTQPSSGPDRTLLEVYKHLTLVPLELFAQLDSEPEDFEACPLHQNAPSDIRIPFANCLDTRLQALRRLTDANGTSTSLPSIPEVRLEADIDATPAISLTGPNTLLSDDNHVPTPTTLLSSRSISLGSASQKHVSALLRLLYLHASINPGNLSRFVPSLLPPLYTVLLQEVEPEDLAHAEADTFWLFETLVGEFAELEDEEGCNMWTVRLDERLKQVDPEFSEQLIDIGLSPLLPHYSHRWLSSLLTHTLPLPAIFPTWDVIMSHPVRERGKHPRLDALVRLCATMLIVARPLLLRGKETQKAGLWDRGLPELSASMQPAEDPLEGVTYLQSYPVDSLGGVDTILQFNVEFDRQLSPVKRDGTSKNDQPGLGTIIKNTMWKGFTNQFDSPEDSDEEISEEEDQVDDGNETERPNKPTQSNTLSSLFAQTVWKGITNQSAMEPSPSPSELSPAASRPSTPSKQDLEAPNDKPSPASSKESPATAPTSLWSYTEKFKESDAMAAISKLSSNWRAKAMLATWGKPTSSPSSPSAQPQAIHSADSSPVIRPRNSEFKRSSTPIYDYTGAIYKPPPRPAVFKNPRDSFILPDAVTLTTDVPNHEESPTSGNPSLVEKTRQISTSLMTSFQRTAPPQLPAKVPPRPLLLGSSSLITPSNTMSPTVTATKTPPSDGPDWSDIMKSRNSNLHRDSLSSMSSLAPFDALSRPSKSAKSDYDSDSSVSRIVPLRRSFSPMAPALKTMHSRPPSVTSTTSSDQTSQAPSTPTKTVPDHQEAPVSKDEENTVDGNDIIIASQPSLLRRNHRKKSYHATPSEDTSDSSVIASQVPARSTRLRSKRYPSRLDTHHAEETIQVKDPNETDSTNLTVPWPTGDDHDAAVTPRASTFDRNDQPISPIKSPRNKEERQRTISSESRLRKTSSNSRTRKVSSNSNKDAARTSIRDSVADFGDDEGYNELLSAYESEEVD